MEGFVLVPGEGGDDGLEEGKIEAVVGEGEVEDVGDPKLDQPLEAHLSRPPLRLGDHNLGYVDPGYR